MNRVLIAAGLLVGGLLGQGVQARTLSHTSAWDQSLDRQWIGAEYWAGPLQDWRVRNGRLECVPPRKSDDPTSRVHLLTIQPGPQSRVTMQVTVGRIRAKAKGWAGFGFGHRGGINDYRHNCVRGTGLMAGLQTSGRLFVGEESAQVPFVDGAVLELSLVPQANGTHAATLTMKGADGALLKSVQAMVPSAKVAGNVLLISHIGEAGDLFWFKDWTVEAEGDDVLGGEDQAWGPILWSQYTLSRHVLKMTVQMPPLSAQDNRRVALQVQTDGAWRTVDTQPIDPLSRTVTFRVPEWDDTRDTPYRAVYQLKRKEGKSVECRWSGTIRRDPVDKAELSVAGFTGNMDYIFPNVPTVERVKQVDPDVLFFSGDQIYEPVAGYGVVPRTAPLKLTMLDYLRKWYLFGWAFGDLLRDRPSVILPDDHDVFQGNVWGHGGRALAIDRNFGRGGYARPPAWVNAVQRTQTAHMPDPVDPAPVEQGITVYFTDMVYGNVSFAIIEDRKFKWGPRSEEARANPEAIELLGTRQLRFLDEWATDWKDAYLKCVLSQTVFAQCHTDAAMPRRKVTETDANGWTPRARDRALRVIRKSFAFMYAGDNHLPTLSQHGIDAFRDAGFAFTVPSIAAGFPRGWYPEMPGKNREPGAPEYTGDYFDVHGNRLTMWAAANPIVWGPKAGDYNLMDKKSSGFGVVKFNTKKQTYTVECWRLLGDLDDPASGQFDGWPKTISLRDNYARVPFGWLPEVTVEFLDPVVQVFHEGTGDLVYALRVRSDRFTPMVFEPGAYTVRVLQPECGQQRVLKGQTVVRRNKEWQPSDP